MRLRVFGDSFAYGDGLAQPERQRWGWHLHKMLRLNGVVCRAEPGASNPRILDTVLETDFHPGDIAVIEWSNCERFQMFDNPAHWDFDPPAGRPDRTLDRRNDELLRALLTLHNPTAFAHITQRCIYSAYTHILRFPNVQQYHITHHTFPEAHKYRAKFYPKQFDRAYTKPFPEIDIASDDAHPGAKSHWKFAKELRAHILANP